MWVITGRLRFVVMMIMSDTRKKHLSSSLCEQQYIFSNFNSQNFSPLHLNYRFADSAIVVTEFRRWLHCALVDSDAVLLLLEPAFVLSCIMALVRIVRRPLVSANLACMSAAHFVVCGLLPPNDVDG